ncbi:MAG: hypothetical protein ACKOOA_11205 [Sediminibacterium sp.]
MLHLNKILPIIIEKRKFILLFTCIATLLTAILLYYTPKEYKSVATLTPINSLLADPARLFNNQIKDLYNLFGNGDDIERMESSADWNNLYAELVREFKLDIIFATTTTTRFTDSTEKAYDSARRYHEAEEILEEKLFARPTDKGQLQLIAWTRFPDVSQQLVTAYAQKIEARIRAAWLHYYDTNLIALRHSLDSLEASFLQLDSQSSNTNDAQLTLLQLQRESLKQLIASNRVTTGQWEQTKAALPGPLFIIDQPRADEFAYRPNYLLVMVGTFLGAFFFSIFLVLVQQRSKLS